MEMLHNRGADNVSEKSEEEKKIKYTVGMTYLKVFKSLTNKQLNKFEIQREIVQKILIGGMKIKIFFLNFGFVVWRNGVTSSKVKDRPSVLSA